MKLRPYQSNCVDSIFHEWEDHASTLAVMATGTGKTQVFSEVVRRALPGRSIILVHREELAFQARDRIERIAGIECQIEMAEMEASVSLFDRSPCVIASVATLHRRLDKFDPEDFGVVIADECHHAAADTWRKILWHFRKNPRLKILGVTATPDRADEKALGELFESVAFDYEITDAIHDGWLVPVTQQMVTVGGLDFSAVRTTAGDLNGADLAAVMEAEENMQGVVGASIDIIGARPSILFATTVRQAEMACDIFNRHRAGMAAFVCGETDKQTRRAILAAFSDGSTQVLCNVGVACLDSETEILTREGWVGCDRITKTDKVACWNNGVIHFSEPLAIEVRDRRPDERMVFLETKNRSIRVTDNHRMVWRKRNEKLFSVCTAEFLVNADCEIPICGQAVHETHVATQESQKATSRRIVANSYILRKKGMTEKEARAEAVRRIKARDSLRRLSVSELTLDQCRWIGFWCGDGTKSKLQTGGVEYVVAGSDQWPAIAAWFEDLSFRCGLAFIKRRVKPTKPGRQFLTRWSFCRGTGFGRQRVDGGVYPIEEFLNKNGADALWAFSQDQFDAFLHGLWCADGDHGQETSVPVSMRIYSSNHCFLDRVQSVAVCRGYRANIQWKDNHGHALGTLSLTKRSVHQLTKYTFQFEEGFKTERVWCVKSQTGFIVTRRRGTVTITGNTEGFDAPAATVCLNGRPTKSRALYAQCAGRVLRPLPGTVDGPETPEARKSAIAASAKPTSLLVDFVGNSGRHKLMSAADILGGKFSDEATERAIKKAKQSKVAVNVTELLEKSEEEIKAELEARKQAEAARKARLVAKVAFTKQTVNPFDAFDISPVRERGWDTGKHLTEKQAQLLRKQGVDPYAMPYAQSRQLLNEMFRRWKSNLATMKQCALLKKHGYETRELTMKDASGLIDTLAKNGWKRIDALVAT